MKSLAVYREEHQRAIMTFVRRAGTLQRLAEHVIEQEDMVILDIEDALRSLRHVTRFYRAARTLEKNGYLDREGRLAAHWQVAKGEPRYPILYFNREGRTLCPDCANRRGNEEETYGSESPATHAEVNYENIPYYCDYCKQNKQAEILP